MATVRDYGSPAKEESRHGAGARAATRDLLRIESHESRSFAALRMAGSPAMLYGKSPLS